MALDSVAVYALVRELKRSLTDGRIDKIHQPEKDELVISVRTYSESFKLVLSASSSNARVHFTSQSKENPKTAPMFCMLLRKHIQSGKIIEISQPEFERIIKFSIITRNEMGDQVYRYLIAELMGRNSNIILTDENGKIIDSARHVDFTQSSVRQILPGLLYKTPPAQDKIAILDSEKPISLTFTESSKKASDIIMSQICGISPITAREIVWKATGRTDTLSTNIPDTERLILEIEDYRKRILAADFSPCIIIEKATGRLIDFSASKIMQYSEGADVKYYSSISDMIEDFYSLRDLKERMKQKSADLVKHLNSGLERLSKKIIIQQKTLSQAENKDKYKKYADLITASAYSISKGDSIAEVTDYYEPNSPVIQIPLDPQLSPIQNAQKYYKKYTKAKTAEIETKKQLDASLADKEYLESMLVLAENCLDLSDIQAIRSELSEQGFIRQQKNNKAKHKENKQQKPHHYISTDGFDIYIGKNNLQNDWLTLKFANASDIWFHTKKIHGSHTIIKLGVNKDIPHATMIEAAELCAYYSKARESNQVPVDYTIIKNVKKPNGAKPGMVIYDGYNTVYVTPKAHDELRIDNA